MEKQRKAQTLSYCKKPEQSKQSILDYQRIENALHFSAGQKASTMSPSLMAAQVGLSEFHFSRLFSKWVGLSPGQFLQYLTKQNLKKSLKEGLSVMDASYKSNLSGSGRAHDMLVKWEAVTPGEYKRGGEGLIINYGVHLTPFGYCLVGITDRGICHLSFGEYSTEHCDNKDNKSIEGELAIEWPEATLVYKPEVTQKACNEVFFKAYPDKLVKVLLKGSGFQVKVWEALLNIPPGRLASYRQVAIAIGMPKACRAVGQAVGKNKIAYLLPCHRVIRESGELGGYRWGVERKQIMIAEELHSSQT